MKGILSFFGMLLAQLGKALSKERGLTEQEKRIVRKVFGQSIDANRIRVTVWSAVGFLAAKMNGGRTFTMENLIYQPKDKPLTEVALVHECVHVWQWRKYGYSYMADALCSQWFGHGYNVTDDEVLRAVQNPSGTAAGFDALEREQQAVVVQVFHTSQMYGKSEAVKVAYKKLAAVVWSEQPPLGLAVEETAKLVR